jgi:plastocyanin
MKAFKKKFARARRLLAAAAVLTAVLAVSGFSAGGGDVPRAAASVAIRNFAFEPATLTVAAGSKVVWTNRDDEPHLVVSAGGQFHASPALDTDDSYAAVFATPGVYTYFCSIHPHMVGKIVVK